MRVALWRDGGEPGQRASQFSRLVTASVGLDLFQWWSIADCRLTLPVTSDSALSQSSNCDHPAWHGARRTRRPVSESSLELVQQTQPIPVSRPFCSGLFIQSSLPPLKAWRWVLAYARPTR